MSIITEAIIAELEHKAFKKRHTEKAPIVGLAGTTLFVKIIIQLFYSIKREE